MKLIPVYLREKENEDCYEHRLALCAKPSVGDFVRFSQDGKYRTFEVQKVEVVADEERHFISLIGREISE